MTPTLLAGLMSMVFLACMVSCAVGMLGDIQTPAHQLKANDEKNKEHFKDWTKIFGKIEN